MNIYIIVFILNVKITNIENLNLYIDFNNKFKLYCYLINVS